MSHTILFLYCWYTFIENSCCLPFYLHVIFAISYLSVTSAVLKYFNILFVNCSSTYHSISCQASANVSLVSNEFQRKLTNRASFIANTCHITIQFNSKTYFSLSSLLIRHCSGRQRVHPDIFRILNWCNLTRYLITFMELNEFLTKIMWKRVA